VDFALRHVPKFTYLKKKKIMKNEQDWDNLVSIMVKSRISKLLKLSSPWLKNSTQVIIIINGHHLMKAHLFIIKAHKSSTQWGVIECNKTVSIQSTLWSML